jgi:hypothetical protein
MRFGVDSLLERLLHDVADDTLPTALRAKAARSRSAGRFQLKDTGDVVN